MARDDAHLGRDMVHHRRASKRAVFRPADDPIDRENAVGEGCDSPEVGSQSHLHLPPQLQRLNLAQRFIPIIK